MRSHSLLLALVAAVVGLSTVSDAAQPISVYKEMQAKASEYFEIEVTDVDAKSTESDEVRSTRYRSKAVVKKIHRSRSKVAVGDTIRIEYVRTARKPGFEVPGPAPNPGMAVGDAGPAYLKRVNDSHVFTLAAEAYSFERLP